MNNRKSKYNILAIIFFILFAISFYYYRLGLGIVFIILAGIFLVVSRKKSSDNDKNDKKEINDKKDIITTEEKSFNEENNLNKEFVNDENNFNKVPETNQYEISDINYTTCLVLCILLGWLQVHRFSAGL